MLLGSRYHSVELIIAVPFNFLRLGETIFAPHGTLPDAVPYEVGNLSPLFDQVEQNGLPSGVFLLKPADSNCLSTIDRFGNKFSVSNLGNSSTERGEPSKDTSMSGSYLALQHLVIFHLCGTYCALSANCKTEQGRGMALGNLLQQFHFICALPSRKYPDIFKFRCELVDREDCL